ncbi:MAG TPA: RNA polymerase sigma factor [Solirubrobacteraceae bacterium]
MRHGPDRLGAFDAIDRRYRGPLTALAAHLMLGSACDPEDAVQDTLLRAHAALRRDDRPVALGPWLRVILRHRCFDLVRESRRVVTGLPTVDAVSGGDALDAVVARERLRTVLAAVADLPDRQRVALSARAIAGDTTDEIAGALGASGGAVKSLVRRARMELEAVAA